MIGSVQITGLQLSFKGKEQASSSMQSSYRPGPELATSRINSPDRKRTAVN
jgi:hypothetical protein